MKETIKLANNRINNPIKTESNLLKKGKKAYLKQDHDILQVLERINAVPVWRNNSIEIMILKDF